jgi:hypothetical protein
MRETELGQRLGEVLRLSLFSSGRRWRVFKIPVIACVATLPLLHEQVDVLDFMDKLDGGWPEPWVVLRALAGGHVVYQGLFTLILAKAVLKS